MEGKDTVVTPVGIKTKSVFKRLASEGEDSPFVIPPSPLMKRLGCGTFVTVYRYDRKRTRPGLEASPWAVKKAKKGRARRSILDRLSSEGQILQTLNHPNIVLFKKMTVSECGDLCLSMEDCGKGLDELICKRGEAEDSVLFTSKEIMTVVWSIANALSYIHHTKKLLHGDMKSGNVLVRGNFQAVKLCDFGVSIYLKDDLSGPANENDTYVGSEPWHSKEVRNGGPITDKADIFAFGLVIWEMLALEVPHVALMNSEDLDSLSGTTEGATDGACDSFSISDSYFAALGTRPPMPSFEYGDDYTPVIGTFVCCTEEDYRKRPDSQMLVETLATIIDEYGLRHDGSENLQ